MRENREKKRTEEGGGKGREGGRKGGTGLEEGREFGELVRKKRT